MGLSRGAIVLATATLAAAECWDENKCIFHQYTPGTNEILYSWDLRGLCNNGAGYTYVNATSTMKYRFEICGSLDPVAPANIPQTGAGTFAGSAQTSTYCNPDYNSYPFTGNFIQFFSGFDPEKVDCVYNTNPTELNPATGLAWATIPNLCATNQCEILATGNAAYDYRWIDNNNPLTGGIRWTAYGDTPIDGDDFSCRVDPNTGYPQARTVRVSMYCNVNGRTTDAPVVNQFWDNGDCLYNIVMTHKSACGSVGDPFDDPKGQPGVNFGYTVLGGCLTVAFYYIFGFLDERGYLDPVKRMLPTFTVLGYTFNGKGGVYGGGGYKSVSAPPSGGSSSAPIASSAYGSTA